ncbi:MAG TPA: TonB-dependent receptor, partial [Bacteroidia bacterium]|nr:TonB-dependent receptor [Bacteroidia bacterium]
MKHSFTKMIVRTIVVCLAFFASVSAHASQVTGTVRDSATKEILSDVIITVQGTNTVVFTDALGQFRLNGLQAGSTLLRFTRLGYVSQDVSVNVSATENTTLNVDLVKGAVQLKEISVTSTKDIGQSLSAINQVDKVLRPTNSAQDLLRLVPGLFIAQHAGGGKAEQIFLRGFDVDHGTDFAVSIDGIPVNMVSHAHGQGYADFHFVIPETVDKLNVNKGLYSARQGDFATSGSGEFFTKSAIDKNMVKMEYGRFDTYRAVGMFRLPGKKIFTGNNENAYIAGEYNYSNSYFESAQHFNRYNVFGKYTTGIGARNTLSMSFSTFKSSWDASGQIPDRAVLAETITRFGSIDNTEGGETSRTNANVILVSGTEKGGVFKNQFFYSHYTFNLYSNFTFFLNDSINGDQIRQTENGRNIYGYTGSYDKTVYCGKTEFRTVVGAGTRIDNGEISLMRSIKRVVRDTIASGKLYEQNINAFIDETVALSDKFSINAGVRLDYFVFGYDDYLDPEQAGMQTKSQARVSPKLSVYYTPTSSLQFYAKSGIGFHSNDARSVVSGEAGNSVPRAYGYEAGSTFKLFSRLLMNVSLWGLDLENELVYVGDEGVVEISGATRRLGVDVAFRWEITKTIFADMDVNYNHGRYLDLPEGENFIPLAPALTSTGGLSMNNE